MPFDEGTGSRRIAQARKRAGVSTPKPKKKKSVYTVRADTGRDKSRVAVQGKARAIVDKIQEDKSTVRTKGGIVRRDSTNIARQRLAAIQALALSDAEKRDLGSYSKAISERRQDQLNPWTKTDKVIGAVTGAYPSEFGASVRHPIDKATIGPEAKRRAIALGVLKPSETFKGALEPAGWAEGGMMAFPGLGPIGRIPGIAKKAAGAKNRIPFLYDKDGNIAIGKLGRDHGHIRGSLGKRFREGEVGLDDGVRQGHINVVGDEHSVLIDDLPLTPAQMAQVEKAVARTRQGKAARVGGAATRVILKDAKASKPEIDEYLDAQAMIDPNEYWMSLAPKQVVEETGKKTSKFAELINVPRALRASFDISAPFRQGLVLGARHPVMFAKQWKPMIQSLKRGGEENMVREMQKIQDRPTFELMKGRVDLTSLDHTLGPREENVIGLAYAERIRGVGAGVRASSRAYVTFLNKFRADAFDHYLMMAKGRGLDVSGTTKESKKLLDDIGEIVNTATGRGNIEKVKGEMALMNGLFFSPRLMLSRLQILNPHYYYKLDPFAREQALKQLGATIGEVGVALTMAKMAGADVEIDPRSSDFGKIKLGDTRIDIMGGLQQYVVAYARVITRQTMNEHGQVKDLKAGFADRSPFDVILDFLENKTAPVPGTAIDYLKGETGVGDPFVAYKDIPKQFVPLGWENAVEGAMEGGPGVGAATLGLGAIGFGVDTYKKNSKKPLNSQERIEAKTKKEQRKVAIKAKKNGWDLPPKLNAAIEFKVKVDARIKALEAEQRNKISDEQKERNKAEGNRFKLTDKQRGAALITALRDYAPGFNYEAAKAYLDGSDPDKIDSYITSLRRYYFKDLEGWGVG